jgi:hypothetical protein
MSGRQLTREQVMSWRENWSWDDRRVIGEHLDRLQARTFSVPPSAGYVRCYNAVRKLVMYIGPGWVEFTRGHEPETIQPGMWRGFALSTFRPHSGSRAKPEAGESFCMVHGLPVRTAGLCDTCEEELS